MVGCRGPLQPLWVDPGSLSTMVAGTRVHSAVQDQALGLSSETVGSARREQFQDHFSQLHRDEQALV